MLTDTSRGLWLVSTLSGTSYVLDLDRRLAIRRGDRTRYGPSRMLRDGDPIPIVTVIRCDVGDSMSLLVGPPGPYAYPPYLRTSLVLQIEQLGASPVVESTDG